MKEFKFILKNITPEIFENKMNIIYGNLKAINIVTITLTIIFKK